MVNLNLQIPPEVKSVIEKGKDDGKRVVVMTCGISGSGKSTLARNIESLYPTFIRLSIDKTVFEERGLYNIDYPASKYEELQEEAESILNKKLKGLLGEGKRDIVLDMAFYSKDTRQEYRDIVSLEGKGMYEVALVVFKGDEEILWKRIQGRKDEHESARLEGEGKEGMSVDRETLRTYLAGFEWPEGEGEIVLKVE